MHILTPLSKLLKRILADARECQHQLEAGHLIGKWQVNRFDDRKKLWIPGDPFYNSFVTAGDNAAMNLITGQGSTAFSNAAAYIGIGDSSTATTAGMTDLQAVTNHTRVAMDATFPSAASSGASNFRATFTSGAGNYSWQEFGVFNASTSGTMLNRGVSNQGTKTSGQSWAPTVAITLA